MGPQVIELLLLAFITFIIINKLISTLGASDEDVSAKSKFGSKIKIKDVTSSGRDWTDAMGFGDIFGSDSLENIDPELLENPQDKEIVESLQSLSLKVDAFTPAKFINSVSKVWKCVITALQDKDSNTLEQLVDSRFIDNIKGLRDHYCHVNLNFPPKIQYSNVTFFGNSIIVKVMISADIIQKEEWTFIRNESQTGSNWFLSNIEKHI
ncbi:MAG: hypothetical protein SFT68_04275 [Rickettsiaceae bacterium]|nr:hypothetical protein [Rickettsiaceae bacterium]